MRKSPRGVVSEPGKTVFDEDSIPVAIDVLVQLIEQRGLKVGAPFFFQNSNHSFVFVPCHRRWTCFASKLLRVKLMLSVPR
jgi:hypothetical protein